MSLLIGKAKEGFEKWIYKGFGLSIEEFNNRHSSDSNHIIIEWLDSVGIVILIDYDSAEGGLFCCTLGIYGDLFEVGKTRHEATTEAIKQANIIYNESN